MRVGSLFAGYDGIGLGLDMLWPDLQRAWFVEFDQAPSKILAHHWPTVPNHGDITAVDWDAVKPVDILTGGFPCQDLSHAGKRLGLRPGTRSGLWEHMAYAIDRLRPRLVVIENVRGLLSASAANDLEPCPWCVGGAGDGEPALRALGAVLGDLAELGYDARWGGVRAADAGAPHGRFRVFIVAQPAHTDEPGLEGRPAERERADERPARPSGVGPVALLPTPSGPGEADGSRAPGTGDISGTWGPYAAAILRWEMVTGRVAPPPTEPGKDGRPRLSPLAVEFMMGLPLGHVTDPAIGLTRAQQLKALGNGVVPAQAALALRLLLSSPADGVTRPDPARSAGVGASPLLPTPQAHDAQGPKTPEQIAVMRAKGHGVRNLNEEVRLLPTPAVNDMGAGKTPEDWDAWTDKMRAAHGNGNGHGKSLAIEAMRLGGGDELA